MKGYICVILLLMNGMIYSLEYQNVLCIIEGQVLYPGQIKQHNCMLLLCRDDGKIFVEKCPKIECPPGKKIEQIIEHVKETFPICCKRPICD